MLLTSSPWGEIQTQREIAPGILQVTTAGHGGYYVADNLHSRLIIDRSPWLNSRNWFEEDVDWSFVVLSFRIFFPEELVVAAEKMLKIAYKGKYEYLTK